ncbi:MAG TPA: VCBS domain-containing protein, partial [Pseudomonadales bacterium]|nr:VCBS domain-containing protein [Pseudomonadales bacterium]
DKAVEGSYGTLYLNSQTGAYVFAPDNQAINGLTSNAEERFTLSVSDDSESVDQTLVINLVAANDTPDIIASVASTTYVETAADDNFIVTTGSLTGSDRDDNATAEYSIDGGSSDSSRDGFDQSLQGRFGTLYLNSVSGLYAYVPNDAEIEGLSEGDRELETFVLSRSDGSANATTRFDVWVTGAADQPIITEAGDSVELIETNSGLSSSGTFTVVDNDLNDAVNMTVMSVAVSGTSTATAPANDTLLAMLTLTPDSLLNDQAVAGSVSWAFDSDNESFDYLAAGETLVLTYQVAATDTGIPALQATDSITVTIVGTNDGPALVKPASITLSDSSADNTFSTVQGNFSSGDLDHNATASFDVTGSVADDSMAGFDHRVDGRYGQLFFNSTTGAYQFVANDTELEALKRDSSEQFSVQVSDGVASDWQTLTVNVIGRNDTPDMSASTTEATLTDTAVDDAFANAITGVLSSTDRDGDAVTYAINGAQVTSETIGGIRYDRYVSGDLGTLYLNHQTGAYRFVADAEAVNALTEDTSRVFTLTASDGDALASQTFTMNFAATNDTPEMAGVTAIEYIDSADNDHFSAQAGHLTVSDRDATDTATFSSANQMADDSRSGFDVSAAGQFGTLYLNSETGAWLYQPNDAAINAITSDDSEIFELAITDAAGAVDQQTLTVHLTAANDTPTISTTLSSTTYVETSAEDTFAAVEGTVAGADRDTEDTLSF